MHFKHIITLMEDPVCCESPLRSGTFLLPGTSENPDLHLMASFIKDVAQISTAHYWTDGQFANRDRVLKVSKGLMKSEEEVPPSSNQHRLSFIHLLSFSV